MAVHPLVEVGLLGVDVPVEVDDPELAAVQVRGDAAGRRVPDGVVAAEHDREGAALVDVADRVGDLVEGLLDVAGDGEHVTEVGDGDRLPQVHPQLEAVRPVQRGDLADPLRAEAGAGAIRRTAVERHPRTATSYSPAFRTSST
jgi:hypothetical protein